MPQMAPIWWTLMYSTFLLAFMFMWMLIYFLSFKSPIKGQSTHYTQTLLNWKW
uniref:ATP synthase F0 subunit 8 n=1 Tax=Lisarda rhypara TaxID=204544 RepID=UPI0028D8C311|nr:ATP synthase F0 subunit 8 [Lisarda rhypara]WMV02028.1 ATP synthase F0 subunit 8 [Lisarda rhypara]